MDYFWGSGSPQAGIPEQVFQVRWLGWLRPKTAGLHQLRLLVDGCAALWVDGQLVISKWPSEGPKPYRMENDSYDLELTDEPHFVQLVFMNPGGNAAAMLQWIPPKQSHPVAIPAECWFLTKAGAQASKPSKTSAEGVTGRQGLNTEIYRGDHFEKLVETRIDPQIHFFWDKDPPGPDLPADYFSIRWTGKLIVPKEGQYHIWLEGDDGYRMLIDGKELVNSFDGSGGSWSANTHLTSGPHDITVEFREGFGSAWISLRWQLYGDDGFPEEPIPPEAFLQPDL